MRLSGLFVQLAVLQSESRLEINTYLRERSRNIRKKRKMPAHTRFVYVECIFIFFILIWIIIINTFVCGFGASSHRIATHISGVYVFINLFVWVCESRCLSASRHEYLRSPCRWIHCACVLDVSCVNGRKIGTIYLWPFNWQKVESDILLR